MQRTRLACARPHTRAARASSALVGRRSREIDRVETDHRDRSHVPAVKPPPRAAQPNSLPNRDGTVLTEAPSRSRHPPYSHARSAARYAAQAREYRPDQLNQRNTSGAVADRDARQRASRAAIGAHAGPPHREALRANRLAPPNHPY
jgi:hypothetical protein